MPTLIVEDVPEDIYEEIRRLAQAGNRTLSQEAFRLLEQGLSIEGHICPYPAPFDLPRPGDGVSVQTIWGGERLPTPFEL